MRIVCSVCHIHVTYRKEKNENVVFEIFVDAAAGLEDLPESKLYIRLSGFVDPSTQHRHMFRAKDMALGDARCNRVEYKWVY